LRVQAAQEGTAIPCCRSTPPRPEAVAGSGFGAGLVDDLFSPARGVASGSEPRKCNLRLNFCGLTLNVRRMRLEYWVQRVAMGVEVQERSRREGCGPEWCLSAARLSPGVDDKRRWNQFVRVLGGGRVASVNSVEGERPYVALVRIHPICG
jgi:hypothetical protein